MPLSKFRRQLIDGSIDFLFAGIKEFKFGEEVIFEGGIDDDKALAALNLILPDELTLLQQIKLEEWGVWEEVKKLREILAHPYPQNRCFDDGIGDDFFLYDRDQNGKIISLEIKGILALSAIHVGEEKQITKDDIVQYITEKVMCRIEAMKARGVEAFVIEEVEVMGRQHAVISDISSHHALKELIDKTKITINKNQETFGKIEDMDEKTFICACYAVSRQLSMNFLVKNPGIFALTVDLDADRFCDLYNLLNVQNIRDFIILKPDIFTDLMYMEDRKFHYICRIFYSEVAKACMIGKPCVFALIMDMSLDSLRLSIVF